MAAMSTFDVQNTINYYYTQQNTTANHFGNFWRLGVFICNRWRCASLRCSLELTCVKLWPVAVQVCRH